MMLDFLRSEKTRHLRSVGELAAGQLLASIDLFVYIRGYPRALIDDLIGGTEVGRLATVALTRALVEHGWERRTDGALPSPTQRQTAMRQAWRIFRSDTVSGLDRCHRAVAERRLDSTARMVLTHLEGWCDRAAAAHFGSGEPVRSGWLTYVMACANDDATMAATALDDFPPVALAN